MRTPTGARSLPFWLLMRAEEEEGENAEPKARHGSSVAPGSPEVCRPLPAVSLSSGLLKAFPDASQLRQEERVHRTGHVSDNRCVRGPSWQGPSFPAPPAVCVAMHAFPVAAVTIYRQLGGLE